MKRRIATLAFLICGVANGAERPSWASHTPFDTAGTLFFVGRSPRVSSEAEGVRMASKDAREQLLRQEFGTTVKVDTTQEETLKDVTLDSRLSEISEVILLKGFKQAEVYSERVNSEIEVWALFTIFRSELANEKVRVADLQKHSQRRPAEAPPKEFDNGGTPKLRMGLRRSEVLAMFGKPLTADKSLFVYSSSEFCSLNPYGVNRCVVWFSENGKVGQWVYFAPGYSTDLDDIPEPKAVTTSEPTAGSVTNTSDAVNGKHPEPPIGNDDLNFHTVRSGDSLATIAMQYDSTADDLRILNNLAYSTAIRIGQKIKIREKVWPWFP